MAGFTRDQILHLAELARIRISEGEIAARLKEFNEILGYVGKLRSLRTEQIEPTFRVDSRGADEALPLEEDRLRASLTTEEALGNAPARQEFFFRVPRVVDREE